MMYVTREVEILKATAKVFNVETEEIETVEMNFYDGETEKQMLRGFENEGYKVLKITDVKTLKFIGRMSRKDFATYCEYYKDER